MLQAQQNIPKSFCTGFLVERSVTSCIEIIAASIDLNTLAQSCPASLASFVDALRQEFSS